MPTPVATARQCLTDEASRALDDAVSVAKRRNHAQTTSLHAVSALLSPSFSLLRESLSRARSSAYSPRLQFRALELCVGVSLDRLPSSKTQDDDFAPSISNSLMAAIKRSQANQRRQPDMYHLNQINNNNNISNNPISISSIKVELKHFVLSILDDPIVSRVFAEAGFRSSDIKMAIIHPPVQTRWATARCPPMFLCNLMDWGGYGGDENCRRIGEVMMKRKGKNPVLVGVCAKDALASFKVCLEKGRFEGLPSEIHGVKMVSLEGEIGGFLGRREKDGLDSKIEEVGLMMESVSSGNGMVVNLGELKVLVQDDNGGNGDCVKELVLRLTGLVGLHGRKLWLIGAAANYETYSKFVGRFPSVEKDWDLHPLPITSSRSSFDALGSKSSLMGSFVPFGGFFPTPSEFRPPLTTMKQPFTRCSSCNEMYERELCVMLREGSSVSIADQYSPSLPSWLQRAESDLSKAGDVVTQVKDVKAASNEKIAGLQKKWDDHCRHLHQNLTLSAPGVSLARPQVPHNLAFPYVSDKQVSSNSSGDTSLNEGVCSNSRSGMQIMVHNIPPQQKVVTVDHKPPSVSVTTDLGLGTIYTSKRDELKPFLQDHQVHLQHFPGTVPNSQGIIGEKYSKRFVESSFLAGSGLREGLVLDPGDYKPLLRKLTEAVSWQCEAVSRISQIVSSCKSGKGGGGVWLNFLGPDKIGKRRVAEALADSVFGSRNHLIAVDLSSQDKSSKVNSLFLCQGSHDFDMNLSRITVVDHIAQELCKKPRSVVFLENIDEADPLVQNSLSRAIQIGKFQDSRGREFSINNAVFVATSGVIKDDKISSPRKEFIKFAEEKILEAKNWQMQIAVRSVSGDHNTNTSPGTRVSLTTSTSSLVSAKCVSNQSSTSSNKRKVASDIWEPNKTSKNNSLDLNLPLEVEVEVETYDCDLLCDDSRAWLEDFFGQADGNVVFKPFDFDALADKFFRRIRLKFEETLRGERMSLEIEYQVMVQILAAAWCSDNRGAVEDWIEKVVGECFAEARERYHLNAASLVRLVACVGVPVNEWASAICLPKRISLSV